MLFDNGIMQLTAYPMSQQAKVEDRSTLQVAYSGKVVASTNGGLPPRRTRSLVLRLDDADLASFTTWFEAVHTGSFKWTDTNGRIWNAQWQGDFGQVEDDYTSVGHHKLTVSLLLLSVYSDAGTGAYGNANVGQMSVQVSGQPVLYFPLAYAPGLQTVEPSVDNKIVTPGFMAIDTSRYTLRADKVEPFTLLSDAFYTALEDYYVNTMQGSLLPFSLVHFRDGTATFRWTDGLQFNQDEGLTWAGQIKLRAEV